MNEYTQSIHASTLPGLACSRPSVLSSLRQGGVHYKDILQMQHMFENISIWESFYLFELLEAKKIMEIWLIWAVLHESHRFSHICERAGGLEFCWRMKQSENPWGLRARADTTYFPVQCNGEMKGATKLFYCKLFSQVPYQILKYSMFLENHRMCTIIWHVTL